MLQELKRRARYFVGPLLGITFTAYFVYHTFEGDRGLRAWRDINQQLTSANDQLATVQAERDALSHRVDGLNPNHVDRDLLDQQIRTTLGFVAPNEIVIQTPNAPTTATPSPSRPH